MTQPATADRTHARAYSREELERLHAGYLKLLPAVERHGKFAFRDYARDPNRLADALAEMRALAWTWYLALVERGKDPAEFPTRFAAFAARHVRQGRLLCGSEAGDDVLSDRARRRRGFSVQSLPEHDSGVDGNEGVDALADSKNASPLDQAQFRLDVADWRKTLSERESRMLDDLVAEYTTSELAARRGVTPGAISQHRRRLVEKYAEFQGEEPAFSHKGRGR